MSIELRVFTEPQQGATYQQQCVFAQTAEKIGYSAFFRSDHYVSMGSSHGLPGPTDAWVTLGALARETSSIRLGTLVSSNTFRSPGQLAIIAAQVDHMSEGRLDFGLGAGWYDKEHAAYAIDFPDTRERFDRYEEALDIVTGLWKTPLGETFDYTGKYYHLRQSPALPKPHNNTIPPIIVGGLGKKRTPALAAKFADEFNVPFSDLGLSCSLMDKVRQACHEQGRTSEPLFSICRVVCVGRTDSEVRARANAIGRDIEDLKFNGLAGTLSEVADKIRLAQSHGVQRIYAQFLDLNDLDHLALVQEAARLV